MKKMIAYRMERGWINRLDMLAKSLRVTKTSTLEYCLDYCFRNNEQGATDEFISYALARREGSEPEIGDPLTDWLGEGNGEGHSE